MRIHPYDLVFALPQFEDEAFPQIREDAETHNVDIFDLEAFSLLASVGELMRTLLPEDSSGTAYEQFRAIVWHCWHYWNSGKQTFELDTASFHAELAAGAELTEKSRYIQIPRNLVFAKMEEGPAEAIDGFFIVSNRVLFVLGLVNNRPGFSVIEGIAEDDGNANFENILPGGEDRLFGVRNQSDLNTLAFRAIAAHAHAHAHEHAHEHEHEHDHLDG